MARLALPFLLLASLVLLAPAGPAEGQEKERGRAGIVTGLSGSATFRPVGRTRWTPLAVGTVLLPGDHVRTARRGAHVAELRLEGGSALTLGPGGLVEIQGGEGVRLFRGDLHFTGDKALVTVEKGRLIGPREPAFPWLERYRETSTEEWMGSLVAQVDGRNVPLTIGTHQVSVTIRDQIAETLIEESFVNHTDRTLEGEFSFPLPADASVSGFGMWIGGELVMADIVERQRARQIYEDIRRRRKDPGLLEWSGGNVFKARVFPIPAHSAKRIRIRYTQVLPLRGHSYRYRYALRSELTRKHPLEKLGIRVSVDSATPIAEARSTSHPVRAQVTEHTALLEYDAEGTTPTRDFEVEVRLRNPLPLTVLPHRRGDDGYFMLLLAPPTAEAAGWKRELTAEGEPLDLLLLADTSASMGADDRKAQAAFLEALLSHLGSGDTFRLAACDTRVVWLTERPLPATDENVESALARLAERASLGWSDLAGAFAEILSRAGEATHVVYSGDGIGTTGDADPGALARRIAGLLREAGTTCHAVSPGPAYEKGVLEAIAALGAGTVREAAGDPASAAHDLMTEISRPALKNLTISFEGVRTARVYPERLPNLPAGTQQVVLGRYLPSAGSGSGVGKVLVRGTLEGKPVAFSAPFPLHEGETGNSFLPRLWARRHLDALLAAPGSPEIREEIVARSEEFGIITPYTSFLVLENDEDRERYGVERRVQMRDAERFFAEAGDRARTVSLREQMRAARTWRTNLREKVLGEIRDLGRSLRLSPYGDWSRSGGWSFGLAFDTGTATPPPLEPDFDGDGDPTVGDPRIRVDSSEPVETPSLRSSLSFFAPAEGEQCLSEEDIRRSAYQRKAFIAPNLILGPSREIEPMPLFGLAEEGGYDPYAADAVLYRFPDVEDEEEEEEVAEDSPWPEEALDLAERLGRRNLALHVQGGLETMVLEEGLHPLRGVVTHRQRAAGFLTPNAWFERREAWDEEPVERWCASGERGALFAALRLGRRRPAEETDRLRGGRIPGLTRWEDPIFYSRWQARLEDREDGTTLLRLAPKKGEQVILFTVDRARGVVLRQETFRGGKPTATVRYEAFVEAGGFWWPTRVLRFDGQARATSRSRIEIRELDPVAVERKIAEARKAHEDVIFLPGTDPTTRDAKQAAHEGRATFADHFRIALHHARAGRWERMWSSVTAAEKLMSGKPGARWLRAEFLSMSRRGEALKAHLESLIPSVLGAHPRARHWLAHTLCEFARDGLAPEEALALTAPLAPAWEEGWDGEPQTVEWMLFRAGWHEGAGQRAEARRLWEEILGVRPVDPYRIAEFMSLLARWGDVDGVLAVSRRALTKEHRWIDYEADRVYRQLTDVLWRERRLQTFFGIVNRWISRRPEARDPYARYLAGLLEVRPREADHWIAARLAEGLADDDGPVQVARLTAAVEAALGRSWQDWSWDLDIRWERPLADLVRRLVAAGKGLDLARKIFDHDFFSEIGGGLDLRDSLFRELAPGRIEKLPLPSLNGLVLWMDWSPEGTDAEVWTAVLDHVSRRREETADEEARDGLTRTLLRLLDGRGEKDRAIDVVRAELGRARSDLVPGFARDLRGRLLERPWSEAREREVLDLVPRLPAPDATEERRSRVLGGALRSVAGRLYELRVAAGLGPREEMDALTRSELRQRFLQAREAARRGLADRLRVTAEEADPTLRPWIDLERLCLETELGLDVEAEATALLTATPPDSEDRATRVLEERCALVLTRAALASDASEDLRERVLSLFRKRAETGSEAYRYRIFRLLLALDRTDALERELRGWTVPALVESTWRIGLANLLAEKGRVEEAVGLLEAVEALGELGEGEYETLAGLYLVLGDEDRRRHAEQERWRAVSVSALDYRLMLEADRLWEAQDDEEPVELEPGTVEMLKAYLSRTGDPSAELELSILEGIYEATKDFRALEPLADAMLGHSPETIYLVLTEAAELLEEVHEEATLDAIVRRAGEVRARARGAADRRALDLLTVLAERRAAEVTNEAGPHGARALEALVRAFEGEWLPGEPRLHARLLASLGDVPDEAFAVEHLRQHRALDALEVERPLDRLAIRHGLCRSLKAYGRDEEAIEGLTSGLAACADAHGGRLPPGTGEAVDDLVTWLGEQGEYAAAEARLLAEIGRQVEKRRKDWYTVRLAGLYARAMGVDGEVSVGRGEALYHSARNFMLQALLGVEASFVEELFEEFRRLHRAADRSGLPAGEDLVRFSREELPGVLARFPSDARHEQVLSLAKTLAGISSDRAALDFLLRQFEAESDRRVRTRRGYWGKLGYLMAEYFRPVRKAKRLGDLAPRLLAVIRRELRADLLSLYGGCTSFTTKDSESFWKEKAGEFARVAREVIEEHRDSPARVLYAAEFLWNHLGLEDEAVQVLQDALARGRLRADGRLLLAQWHMAREEWDEAVRLLWALSIALPDRFEVRPSLIRSLHEAGRDGAGRMAARDAARRFRSSKDWAGGRVRELADASLDCEYYDLGSEFFTEALSLYRTGTRHPDDEDLSVLSHCYEGLARSASGLGHHEEAVDAATAAVVAWGEDLDERQSALDTLEEILGALEDLDAWAAKWVEEAGSTGLDSAVVRFTLGRIYLAKKRAKQALPHLLAARRLQPEDPEIHKAVIDCHRRLGDRRAEMRALVAFIHCAPAKHHLYDQLARRLVKAGRKNEAERVWTSLAEFEPHEADGHRKLARIRERQKRLPEAIDQWEQVARTRAFDPAGWFSLVRAQLRAGLEEDARRTVTRILERQWDPDHGDVHGRARKLLE